VQVLRSRTGATAGAGVGGEGAGAGGSEAGEGGGAAVPAAPVPFKHHLFMDETVPSFFRRPTWTPDGALLLTPTGQFRGAPADAPRPTTYAFSRASLAPAGGGRAAEPFAHLPGAAAVKPAVAVRVSPAFYRLREGVPPALLNPAFNLPYRLLVAVATLDSVVIYDTQLALPVAAVANLHYDKLTDLAWAPSGRTLIVTSIDGYCSAVCFEDADVGSGRLAGAELPAIARRKHGRTFAPPRAKKGAAAKAEAAAAAAAIATPPKDGAPAAEGEGAAAKPAAGGKRKLAATLVAPLGGAPFHPVEGAAEKKQAVGDAAGVPPPPPPPPQQQQQQQQQQPQAPEAQAEPAQTPAELPPAAAGRALASVFAMLG
jgi:chromatin assembly factor 1 subunit B